MLHGIDPETHAVSALHHATIDADVDPALIRVADNDVVCGADVAAAIAGMPEGRRKGFEIYGVAFLNTIHYRPIFDDFGGNQPRRFCAFLATGEAILKDDCRAASPMRGKTVAST